MLLKACLNGGVRRAEHPAVPISPAELAADAARCRLVGAGAVHVHPRDRDGRESLAGADVAAAVGAIRRACPGLPVGVSTGAWIEPDPAARVAAVRGWTVLPDFASVNAHEPGAELVAAALHERGVGVEAGVWTVEAAANHRRWRVPCLRVLVECMRPEPADALADAVAILGTLPDDAPPVLLHGEGPATWAVLADAVRRGLATRIGLEDIRTLPDGSPAPGNAELVAAAVALGAG
ncbi:3-keto-5-aminohexanoate cleavage protein [Micromonospora sp. WMMD1102]|uniref:3-keto-5-aminohexanoate cleavage protein n=1 Tax=Micromonospora sp. WMMD1102 TaxID=3016105 RepID=UPI00241565D9|nr:3-keto-5-aminohexanoate cleavage protein [Micromonospora sp. WMMD1102]MDG4785771.1 3-keto-5-aminohexanoate cleavage protein [Micromonospora sp. WMMD1102]